MKFVIAKRDLAHDASAAASAAAKKPSMPVIGNVMIRAASDGVSFSGTDLFLGARVTRACNVVDEGSVLVLAKQFSDACRALPDGDVTVRIDGNRLEIKSGKVKHRIPWTSAGDYPSLPECDDDAFVAVPAATLGACVGSVSHAMFVGDDVTKANVAGVHVRIADCACVAMATNGHAAAMRSVECPSGAVLDVMIPYKSIADLRKIADAAKDGDVYIAHAPGYLFVRHDVTTISIRLTGEAFPNAAMTRILAMSFKGRVLLARESLIDVLKNVLVNASGEFSHVDFTIAPGSIGLKTVSDGDSTGEMDVDYAGDLLSIRLSGSAVVNALAAMTHDVVAMCVRSSLEPVTFVPSEVDGAAQVVMPARP
jgi:DNA polymerase-3 subunit beta